MEEIGFQAKIKNPDSNYVGSKLLNAAVRKLCSPFLSPHNLRQTGTWLHRSEGLPLSNDPDRLVLQCCSAAVLHSPALTAGWALQCCMPPVQPVSSWDQERNSASDRMTETALHLLILWILSRLAPNWKYSSQIETKKWETMRKCSGLSSSMVADYLQAFSDFNLKADITTDT